MKQIFLPLILSFMLFSVNNVIGQTQCPTNTDFSGAGVHTYTVPFDAVEVTITLNGADGGNTASNNGGAGAALTATFPVCPGCTVKPNGTIEFYLGGAGESSADKGGAGGGGASVAITPDATYPLILAGGGGGAGFREGTGGKAQDTIAGYSLEQGGTQSSGGGGGGGAGSTSRWGVEEPGEMGAGGSDGGGTGGSGLSRIMTASGGAGGSAASNGPIGKNGGIGGGGAGGEGDCCGSYGGGGGGGGFNGGDGGRGGNSVSGERGNGGTSYIWGASKDRVRTSGATGGGNNMDGKASICYTSAVYEPTCDPSVEQLFNHDLTDYEPIDWMRFYRGDQLCFEGWTRTGAVSNFGGTTQGALCTEARFRGPTAKLEQELGNICKSQELEMCFSIRPDWIFEVENEITFTLGGEELIVFYGGTNNSNPFTYRYGTAADEITVTKNNGANSVAPGEKLSESIYHQVCVTVYNYNGNIPALLEIEGMQTQLGGTDYENIMIGDFTLAYSEVGSPALDTLTPSEKPASCIGTFDLTTIEPTSIPPGLTLSSWAVKAGAEGDVTNPNAVPSGTYELCYSRETTNPECSTTCEDIVCTEVVITCSEPAPINLLYFEAEGDNSDAILQWKTATETMNDYFQIERSIDGKEFTPIAEVKGAGNSTEETEYKFTDDGIGVYYHSVYYRFKQVDFNGDFAYSSVKNVKFNKDESILIFPNPVSSHLNVKTNGLQSFNVEIYDMLGQLVSTHSDHLISMDGLENGSYFVKVLDAQGEIRKVQMIMVVK